MRKAFTGLILGLACWAVAAASLAETKYAVCVGINEYKEISSLEGCVNDANHFYTNLVARGGWLPGNMTKLTDSKATKDAIRKAISNYAAKAVSGDTFVYNHSSHGGQISGTDTYLCVYDEVYEDDSTAYNDWEVAADLQKFAAGVKVVVIVDACHSGGLFRDAQAREAANADLAANWDFAGRVSTIMEENRAARLARGERGVEKTLAASEIGWVTAAKYSESSYDGGYYADNQQGGVFMCAGTEGWMSGAADTQYGDGDGYENAYEFWAYAYPICTKGSHSGYESYSKFYPQHTNDTVLKSVNLGWGGDEEPTGVRFASIPAQTATVGQELAYTVVATNSDGSTGKITYSVTSSSAPSGSYSVNATSGAFSFTPATDGSFSFTFVGTNTTAKTGGKTTMTVTASLAAPAKLSNSGITASSFTANWGAVAGAASYLLDVSSEPFGAKAARDDAILSENFDSLADAPLNSDVSSKLDDYLAGTGWTGSKVFGEGGAAKLGSSKANGWIATPALDLSAGGTVSFSLTKYGSSGDGNTVLVTSVSGSTESEIGSATPGDGETVEFAIPAADASTKVKIATSAKRAIIDDLVITAGGGADVLANQEVSGTSYTVEGLATSTYYWRVRAVGNAKGPFSETEEVSLVADPTAPPSIRAIDDIEIDVGETATAAVKVSAPEEAPVTSLTITAGDAAAKLGEDGVFTFAPESAGVYPFTITAVNANGSVDASFTVTATLAEPETPEVPTFIDSDAFTAEWTAVPGAESYELDVIQGATSGGGGGGGGGTVALSENFSTVVSNSSAISDFSTVTTNPGWSGENAYPADGMIKFGTSKKAGTFLSPAVAVSGTVTISWTGKSWTKDNTVVNVGVSEDGGKSFTETAVQLTETLAENTTSCKVVGSSVVVRWQSSAASNQRFFISQLAVSSGEKTRELSGTHVEGFPKNVGNVTSYDVTGLQPNTEYTFAFRAIAGDEATEWSEPVSVKTADGPAAPAWTTIPAQSAAVGYPFRIDLSAYVSGVPTPTLSLTAGTADLDGTVLSFTPDAVATYTFTVTASNSSGDPADATFTVAAVDHVPTKYAVCVGINDYVDISGLAGCVNDSIYMEQNLVERGGWAAENVVRLNDSKATKAAIRAAIKAVADKAVAGDTFVYQHSSHGGQFNATEDDEDPLTGEEGKATFLCVYDEDYYDNTTAYNDYEIAADLAAFNAGVKVAVIVDACHSGGLFKSKEAARAAAASFDLAGRVTAIMEADRAARKALGENVAKSLAPAEIGWATAAEYYEYSYDGGFYHTDEWLTNNVYGDEYYNENTQEYNYPSSYKQGGVFLASATWNWWNGDADTNGDGSVDALEFWQKGYDFCSVIGEFWYEDATYNYFPQSTNVAVLKSIELGWVKDPRPAAPANPKASNVASTSFTASWDASEGAASYNLFVQKKLEAEAGSAAKGGEERLVDESFEDGEIPDGWTASSGVAIASGKNGDGDYCVAFKAAGANLITPAVDTPNGISFMYKRSSNTADWRLAVEVGPSPDGPWTALDTVKDVGTEWKTFSSDISATGTQYVKFTDGRASGAAERYIDLVQITGAAGTWEDVEGYAPASVADTSKDVTGLDSDTDYRFWITATDAEGLESADSDRVSLHTLAEDSAPVWSTIPELAAVAGEMCDFTASDYVTASPAATITLVSVTAPEGVTLVEGDDYVFEAGYLVFTPAAEGTYTFEFKAENDLGNNTATLTIVAAAAPVTVPELTLSNPTADSFKAEWTACTGVESYTLQVSTAEFKGVRDGDAILSEDFSGFTATNSSTDVSGKLDEYTSVTGWTGSKIYADAGRIKLGTGSANGYIVTPAVDIPAGAALTCKIAQYGSDTGTVDIQLSANGGEFASLLDEAVKPAADGETVTVNFAGAASGAKIKFVSSAKRFYLDDVVISGSGGGSSVLTFTVEGTSKTVDGLEPETTYYARVKGTADWSAVKSITTEADVPVAPAWSAIPAQTVVAGENLVVDLTAYVSGSPKPTITADAGTVENGVLTVSFAEAGDYTVTVTAENSEDSASTTIAVTVTAAPVTVPVLALSNPTANSFDASWTECTGVSSYTLQVSTAEFKGVRDGDAILSEDFSGFTATNSSTDVSGKLDEYTSVTGWTGSKIYADAGRIKLGTGSANGYIVTPAVDIPAGAALTCKIAQYGSDTGTVDIQLSANGGEFASLLDEAVKPAADGETVTVNFAEAVSGAKIKFVSSAKRFYLDDVVISANGGGSSVMTFTVEGTFKTVDGLEPETTYYARVKGAADWSAVESIMTQADVPTQPEWLEIPAQTATVGQEFNINLSDYVTGSPFPTITVDGTVAEGGNWSFTPEVEGSVTFELVATNTEGSNSTTLTVVVSEAPPAPVTVPELTLSNATANSFEASWTACTDVSSYTLQVSTAEFKGLRDGDAILSEDFAGFTATNSSTDVSGKLDEYTAVTGWTGSKVYADAGHIKLGTGSANGYIVTPAVDIPAGATLTCKIAQYGSDTGTVDIQLSANGGEFASLLDEAVKPVADGETITVDFAEAVSGAKIQFVSSAKRFYLDDVVISGSGGGSSVLTFTVEGTSKTVDGLEPDTTYYARVKGAAEWSEVKHITTTAGGDEPVEVDIAEVTIDSANHTLSFEKPDGAVVMTTSDLVNGPWVEYEGEWPIPITGDAAFFRIGNPPAGN